MELIFRVISQVIFLYHNWSLTNPAVEQHLSKMSKCLSTFRKSPSHYSCATHGWPKESNLTDRKNKITVWEIQLPTSQSSSPTISLLLSTGIESDFSKKPDACFFTIAIKHVCFLNNLPVLCCPYNPHILFIMIQRIKNSGSLY